MVIVSTISVVLYLQLFSVLTESGHSFYKDDRFWRTLLGLLLLTALAILLI